VALVVVLVILVVVLVTLVVVAPGLVFWQVALLQKPVMVPETQGTPCFLKMLVSQVMEAVHLGLLWHGPILRPQIWLTLFFWHWRGSPGALQHAPPSQVSGDSIIPFPHLRPTMLMVEVNDGEMELVKEMDPDGLGVKVMVPVEVNDGVMELENEVEPVAEVDGVGLSDLVVEAVIDMEIDTVLETLVDTVFETLVETELEKLVETEAEPVLEIEVETELEREVEVDGVMGIDCDMVWLKD
jgi:hypothetical protein